MKQSFKVIAIILAIVVVILGIFALLRNNRESAETRISSFEECVEAGYPVMESYPEQCAVPGGSTFTRYIGNELEKAELIRIDYPRPNTTVETDGSIVVTGEARGTWFFEADFPVELKDSSGQVIGQGIALADGEWMTEDFVPFTAEVVISRDYVGEAELVLHRNNPSDLRENDDELVVPVIIEASVNDEEPNEVGEENPTQPPPDDEVLQPEHGSRQPVLGGGCYVGGCSGQVCSDDPGVITTCEWREEYACYKLSVCERQASGECGWTETDEFRQCLGNTSGFELRM